MPKRPSKSVDLPNGDYIKSALLRISHQPIECRTAFFDAAHAMINVLFHHDPTSPRGVLSKFDKAASLDFDWATWRLSRKLLLVPFS
jgi:hypothetical protein